ncbi:hypothetical protein V1478_013261 [Vespula squamosa]|uniref:Uncharacterized protein n=1 Tax=Vespula squamosa TaxID=30214 RepID=A0ABD2AAW9_VESSQ
MYRFNLRKIKHQYLSNFKIRRWEAMKKGDSDCVVECTKPATDADADADGDADGDADAATIEGQKTTGRDRIDSQVYLQ